MSELITSPVGTIVFMSLDQPRHNKFKDRQEYSIRLEFGSDATTWRQQIEAVNPGKIVDTGNGTFAVSAATQYAPTVTDAEGNVLSAENGEVPHFGRGCTGQAIMTVKPVEGTKGGTLYLSAVGILNLDQSNAETGESLGGSLTDLRAALNAVK